MRRPSASDASALWSSFSPGDPHETHPLAPRLVGNLSGFPVSVRNEANRRWVSQLDRRSQGEGVEGRQVALWPSPTSETLHTLNRVEAGLKPTKHGPARELLSVDPSGEGKAVIVLGNLQTADYVTYMVPGMFYTVDGQLGAWTGDAADLYSLQKKWLARLAASEPGGRGQVCRGRRLDGLRDAEPHRMSDRWMPRTRLGMRWPATSSRCRLCAPATSRTRRSSRTATVRPRR